MNQVITLNLPCVNEYSIELKQALRVVKQVSGLHVRLRCWLKHIKLQVEDISNA